MGIRPPEDVSFLLDFSREAVALLPDLKEVFLMVEWSISGVIDVGDSEVIESSLCVSPDFFIVVVNDVSDWPVPMVGLVGLGVVVDWSARCSGGSVWRNSSNFIMAVPLGIGCKVWSIDRPNPSTDCIVGARVDYGG